MCLFSNSVLLSLNLACTYRRKSNKCNLCSLISNLSFVYHASPLICITFASFWAYCGSCEIVFVFLRTSWWIMLMSSALLSDWIEISEAQIKSKGSKEGIEPFFFFPPPLLKQRNSNSSTWKTQCPVKYHSLHLVYHCIWIAF